MTKAIKNTDNRLLFFILFGLLSQIVNGQNNVVVPDWALPASATHKQISPPSDFHRAAVTLNEKIGIFDGQSDVGAALVPSAIQVMMLKQNNTLLFLRDIMFGM